MFAIKKMASKRHLQYTLLYLLLTLFACSNKHIAPQMTVNPNDPCNCSDAFTELTQKLEANYVGLALQRGTDAYETYEARKKEYALKVADQADDLCTATLSDFVSHFKDGHLFVWDAPRYDSSFLEKQKPRLMMARRTTKEIDTLLVDRSDPIVGKWSDGESIFAIVKEDSAFKAYLIKTRRKDKDIKPGFLKMSLTKQGDEYEGSYISYAYAERYVRVGIHKEGDYIKLIMGGGSKWRRSEEEEIRPFNANPAIEKINEVHTLITIPSFSIDAGAFKKLLEDNHDLINHTQHLIIDIRGNTGGNAIYFPLISYFANSTLTSEKGYVLTSPDNVAYFKRFVGFLYSSVYSPLLKRMKASGEIVDGPKYKDRKFSAQNNSIARVSILTDNSCASAAESFILHAKGASDKVITFGMPTAGVIDYTSVNVILLENSARQYIYFGYPTGTWNQKILTEGYNQTGILPDVSVSTAGDKALEAAIKHFERN
ncbi:MAG: hypothetical protein HRU41_36490 [Saprospiraceae bacterium]|nr:hypothetical protein [Saprospiraceae bacterium]